MIQATEHIIGIEKIRQSEQRILSSFLRPRYRTMLEFAEQEIVIPDGKFEGRKFRVDRQPLAKLWFDLVANPHWYECVITGPSQSGKTLIGFIIPMLYHLFELRQRVIGAAPDFDVVADKWSADLMPAIERTRYRDWLPKGKIGKKQALIEFRNGAKLRWMTSGGGDKSRAAFTAQTVCMTETDGFDTRTATSAEANKIEQIEARMRSYELRQRRIYKECTVSVEEAHTWQRYQHGTRSVIKTPCPHCKAYVALEREDFKGWQEAQDDTSAVERAAFFCNSCGVPWTEQDRRRANQAAVLVHEGQTVTTSGQVVGPPPRTHTLGFRWSAVNNLLVPAADIGLDEFKASRSVDEDDDQRKMAQFVWSVPYRPAEMEDQPLTIEAVTERNGAEPRGVCPEGTKWVTVGIDVNKPVLHWTAIAWVISPDRQVSGRIIDYGKNGIRTRELGFEEAIAVAVKKLHKNLGATWENAPRRVVSRVVIDSRWSPAEVDRARRLLRDKRWRSFIGLGQGHWKRRTYNHPEAQHKKMAWVGNACYEKFVDTRKSVITFADANWWKTWLHSRLQMEQDEQQDGCLTLFAPSYEQEEADRVTFARHLTAERESVRFEHGKGYIKEWVAVRSANHWLDSTYMACVAGNRFWHKLTRAKTTQRRKRNAPEESRKRPSFSPFK